MKIFIDGEYYNKEDAKISVFDHGLLYGDGVFEGIRVYNGKVFKLSEHVDRLFKSAKYLHLKIEHTHEELSRLVEEAVRLNGNDNAYVRLIITRGTGTLGIDPEKCARTTTIIIADNITLYPKEYYQSGISIITASTRRIPSDCLDSRVKSLNYLNNIMAKLEAKQSGSLEAVMLNKDGFVAECTTENIFIVSDNKIISPENTDGSLEGITLSVVSEIADSLSISLLRKRIALYDLYNSDECFLTGTGAEIMPVSKIDGRTIGSGKVGKLTEMLMNGFKELIIKSS